VLLQTMSQTNAPMLATTSMSGPHAMSLSDCLQEALAHNLDVQIQRVNPKISLYNLNADYAGYDPTFNFSGQHNYNDQGAEFQNGLTIPGLQDNADSFSSDFKGSLPWGMTYDLGGSAQSTKGENESVPFQNSSGQIGALSLTQPLLKNFWIDNTRLTIRVAKNRLQYSDQGVRLQLITN